MFDACGVGGPKALPRPVRDELARRRAELAGQVEGLRTLDLGSIIEGAVPAPPTGTRLDAGGFDDRPEAIVGVVRLAAHPDPAALLAACFALLHPEGRLLLVEPYRRPGPFGRLQAAAAPAVERRFGCRVDLAVPALLRSAGFVIATIERFTMPTVLAPLRPFVFVDARAGFVPTAEVAP